MMLTLLKNIECYCPQNIGIRDIIIASDKIYKILPIGELIEFSLFDKIISCDGLCAFPGLIDQHVHIIGGGGEQGFGSHITEIEVQDILMAGVTTLVGLLGADSCLRSLECLYAKAKALQIQGITTFIYSGSYQLPAITLTGNITRDIVLIDKVIGAGEIAISDHRSSHPTINDLLALSSQTHIGGLLGGKAGVVHLHMGDGKEGLKLLFKLLNESDLPIEEFVPTHVNRNPNLFRQAVEFVRSGGNIDLTSGETSGIPVSEAVRILIEEGIELSKVTISSDANGSIPEGGSSKMQTLYDDIKECITEGILTPEKAIGLATENVAKVLKIYPKKGTLQVGSDADILITDRNYEIQMLFCMGKLLVENGNVLSS